MDIDPLRDEHATLSERKATLAGLVADGTMSRADGSRAAERAPGGDRPHASGLGLEAQRDTIQRYADAHGWDLIWYADEGLSAKSMDRPQLQAALARMHVILKRRDVTASLSPSSTD